MDARWLKRDHKKRAAERRRIANRIPDIIVYEVRYTLGHLTAKEIQTYLREEKGREVSLSWITKVRAGINGGIVSRKRFSAAGQFKDYKVLKGNELRLYFIKHATNLLRIYERVNRHFEETGHFNAPARKDIQPEQVAAAPARTEADAEEHPGTAERPPLLRPEPHAKAQHAQPSRLLVDRFRGA